MELILGIAFVAPIVIIFLVLVLGEMTGEFSFFQWYFSHCSIEKRGNGAWESSKQKDDKKPKKIIWSKIMENTSTVLSKGFSPRMIWKVILGLLVFCLLWGSFYTVNQGDRALVLRLGKIVSTGEPGFHFKAPIIDTVVTTSVRSKKVSFKKLPVYSMDIQSADIILSVNYSLNPSQVASVYTRYGRDYEERVILPQIQSKAKDAFGKYNAVSIVQGREKIASQIVMELASQFQGTGIDFETVQIENIDYSDSYEKSVSERMNAEVEVAKVKQNLQREITQAEMVRTQAQGKADAKEIEAKAEAARILAIGQAEAQAIAARTQALKDNPGYVELIKAEKWNGVMPTTMPPNTTLPFMNIKP